MEKYLPEELPACAALKAALFSISQYSKGSKYKSTSLLSYKCIGLQNF